LVSPVASSLLLLKSQVMRLLRLQRLLQLLNLWMLQQLLPIDIRELLKTVRLMTGKNQRNSF
jgi:hypothetical protein